MLGGRQLDEKAAVLLKEGRRLQRRVSSATGNAVKRVYFPTLLGMLPRFMPSGYAPVLAESLKVATTVRFAGFAPGVSAKVSAPTGGPKGRAVEALERGEMRAPSWPKGRRNTWKWHRQRIPKGFGSTPMRAIKPLIVREIDSELAAIKRDVER